jgi:hypothetical protein
LVSSGHVVVVAKGWSQRLVGPGFYARPFAVGLVLRNQSRTRDALAVRIEVAAWTKFGIVAGASSTLAVVPAGSKVYLGGGWTDGPSVRDIRVRVDVDSEVGKRYRLPPVTKVRIDRANRTLTATVTNPYRTPISIYRPTFASTVFFDRRGTVIGGSALCRISVRGLLGRERIKPGGRAAVDCRIPRALVPARIASAGVTVSLR